MSLARLYGMLCLLYGAFLLAATFQWRQPMFWFLQTEAAIAYTFIGACVLALPFIITYTQLGLNSDGDEPPEVKERNRVLNQNCPSWKLVSRGSMIFVALATVLALAVTNEVHPFFAFSAAFSIIAGVWFLYVYPIAKKLFGTLAAPRDE